jgi:hypothetical protein
MPMMFSGRLAASAIRAMGMADVLDANTAWGGKNSSIYPRQLAFSRRRHAAALVTRRTCLMTLCLRPRSSNTASMTRSACLKCAPQLALSSVKGMTRDVTESKAYLVILFFFSFAPRLSAIYFSPLDTPPTSRSLSSTR